jgi:hypothetical protein
MNIVETLWHRRKLWKMWQKRGLWTIVAKEKNFSIGLQSIGDLDIPCWVCPTHSVYIKMTPFLRSNIFSNFSFMPFIVDKCHCDLAHRLERRECS